MGPDNSTLAATEGFERAGDDANPELIASFPYAEVKDAIAVCAGFADGYGVLNAAGKTFKGSCSKEPIAFWLGQRTVQYNTGPMEAQ